MNTWFDGGDVATKGRSDEENLRSTIYELRNIDKVASFIDIGRCGMPAASGIQAERKAKSSKRHCDTLVEGYAKVFFNIVNKLWKEFHKIFSKAVVILLECFNGKF